MSKHMTKTQWKDALRLIKKRIVSFISIILVTAIGYSVFLACFFGHSAVQETIVETFDKYNYRDLNIVSTKGFSEDDVTSLKTIQGLSDIEGLCSADMHINHNDEAITATISSKTKSIGQYILKEGREIESTNECIVSYNTLKLLDLSLGDTIEIIDTKDIHLTQHTFVITGTCVPLDDFKTNNSLKANIFVKNDVFNHPDNLFDYTNIYLTCTTDEKIAFSDEYKTIIKYITSNIEDVAEKRTVIRDDTLLIEGRDQISDAEIKLANGKSEIEKGKIEIQENESKLLEANIQLQIAQAKLDIYKQQLDSSEKEINAGQEKLEKAEKELADAKKQLNDARIQLDNAYILIENGKTQIKENEELLAQAKEKLDEGEVQLSMLEAVLSASSAVMELDISSLSQQLYELLSANWDPEWPSLDIDIFSLALYTNQLKTTLEDTIYSVISDAGVILSGADLSNFISNLASSPMWSTLIDSYNSLIEAKNLYVQLKEQYETGLSELEILKSQLADYENSVNNYIALLNFALSMVDINKETLSKNLYDLLLSYWDNTWPELQMSTVNLVLSAYQLGDSLESLIGNIITSAGVNLSTTELNNFINNIYSSVSWQLVAYSYELLAQAASAYNEVYDSYNQAVLLYENAKIVFESETSRLNNLYQTITSSLSVIEFDEAQLVSQIYTLLSTYWDPSWPSLEMTMLYAAMYSYQIKNTLENTIYNMISALGVNLSRSEFEDFISNLKIEDIYPTLESSFNALIEAKEAYNNLKEQYNQGLRELELIKNQILSNEITVSIISSLMQSASNLANFDISNLSEIVYNLLSSQWDNAWPELQMDVINVVLSAYQFKSSVDDMIEKVLEASGVNLDSSELEDYINTLSSTLMYSIMQTTYDLIAKAQSVYDDLNQKYTLAVFMYDLAKAQLEQSENKLETLYQILSVSASVIGFDEAKLVSQIYDFISSFWNKSWPKIDMALLTLTSYANQFASSLEQTILNILESSGVLLSQADFTEYISRLKTFLLWNTIESTHSLISQAKDTYNGLCEQYAQGMTEWKAGKIQYENGKSEIEKAKTQLEYGIKQANDGEIQYQIGLQLYNVNLATYNSSLAEFEEGKETFLKAKEELENGQKELDSKKAEYDDGVRQLAEGKAKLAEAEIEYEEGVEKIADGKRELSLYMPCKWVVSNRDNYKDYVELKTITETIYAIGFSFAGLFSLLSLLVCYSTISKIISEQEKLLGTFKALGFTSGEIIRKFLVFGSFATVSGGLVGIGVSFFLQEILIVSVNNLFELGGNKLYASVLPMIVLIGICVLVGAFAAYASCKKMLSRSSLSLLSGEQQVNLSAHKTNAKSRKPRSLYAGLIWRNIKSDLNRVMITIACIAGCTMLIIIGFSYKASYTYIQEYDYEIFRKFDAYVSVDTSKNDSSSENIQDIFEKYEMKYLPMYQFDTMFVIGEETQGETLCCVDSKKASNFFYVYDITKNKETPVPNVGVTINRRLSESFNLAIGDYIQIIDTNGNAIDVPVTGIFELYATPTVLMSYEYAKTIFGESNVNYNMYAVYHHEENVDEVLVELESKEYFNSYNTIYGMKQNLQSTINITNVLVVIMIVMSGIMAFVVLLNLNRIQINQKRKELLVMRINGFTFRETANYLLRENISTTIIGIVLGIIIGIVMSYINMRLTETAAIQMMRQPSVLACVIAAGTTFLFSIIIQAISLHSIKKMKLTEI